MTSQTDKDYERFMTSLDEESDEEWERRREEREQAERAWDKHRMPLYVIVAAAFVIGTINGIYFDSGAVFLMCLLFGGGTLIYLWRTWYDGPSDLKRSKNRKR